MRNAHVLYAPSVPHRIADVQNKKQKLRNDFIDFLEEGELTFPSGQVSRAGEALLSKPRATLRLLLWLRGPYNS